MRVKLLLASLTLALMCGGVASATNDSWGHEGKDVCPNIEGKQATVPEGDEIVNGECVPTPPATPPVTPPLTVTTPTPAPTPAPAPVTPATVPGFTGK